VLGLFRVVPELGGGFGLHLANPVPSRDLPCGDISPVVGITGTPIIADGLVWTIGADHAVHGLNPASGQQVLSIPFGGSANHFPTPSAAEGLLLLSGTSQVFAFMGPAGLPPAPPAS
jgi:hypothetical protein